MVRAKEAIKLTMLLNSLAVLVLETASVRQILKFKLAVQIEHPNIGAAIRKFGVVRVARLGLIWSQLRCGQMFKSMSIMPPTGYVAKYHLTGMDRGRLQRTPTRTDKTRLLEEKVGFLI